MDRELIRSVIALMLASVLLASATVLLSLTIDRYLDDYASWPVIPQEPPQPAETERRQPIPLRLDSDPVDENLRKLWETLKEDESASQLRFPIEVEEAMMGSSRDWSIRCAGY